MKKYELERAIQIAKEKRAKFEHAVSLIDYSYAKIRDEFVKKIITEKGNFLHRFLLRYPKIFRLWIFRNMKPKIYTKADDINFFKVLFRGAFYDIAPVLEDMRKKKMEPITAKDIREGGEAMDGD